MDYGNKTFRKLLILIPTVLIMTLFFTGCAKKGMSNTIKVGSKEYTEQLLLGQITIVALENAGFKVEDNTNIAGTDKVRGALLNKEIDVYWEYTGNAWLMNLKHDEVITDSQEIYEKVKKEDRENGIVWLKYAPFNNTYTIMLTKRDSEKLGIKTISELGEYVRKNPNKLVFASDHQFSARPDGLGALEDFYGFEFKNNLKTMETGIIYRTLKEGKVDAGMGFATDGRIKAFNLVNLEDDKHFFPVYNPAPILREDTIKKYPEIEKILNDVSQKLDTETMTLLNYRVDIEEKDPKEVARDWLKSEDLID